MPFKPSCKYQLNIDVYCALKSQIILAVKRGFILFLHKNTYRHISKVSLHVGNSMHDSCGNLSEFHNAHYHSCQACIPETGF